jgi:hypothetical protein
MLLLVHKVDKSEVMPIKGRAGPVGVIPVRYENHLSIKSKATSVTVHGGP